MQNSVLRLFNGIQVNDEKVYEHNLAKQICHGFVLDERIHPSHFELVCKQFGFNPNSTFHKSWKTIQDADMETLVIQQIVHYITTYGFESLGIFDGKVYIPNEVLDLDGLGNLPLTYVKALTRQDVFDAVVTLANSGIALSQQTLDDIMIITEANRFEKYDVQNRELKIRLYDYYHIVPDDPEEWLRYTIFKITNETLLIKSRELIEKIKLAGNKVNWYLENAPDNVGEIFFRYKPLFLAMRHDQFSKRIINQIRKKADRQHKPLGVDYLNDVTRQLANDELDLTELSRKLESATIFRQIRLAYALVNRIKPADSIAYQIRNGKTWVTDFEWNVNSNATKKALKVVLDSIADSMRDKVEGKTFYIPEQVYYTLPATEKQFIGNLPNGTFVGAKDNLIVGVNWSNNGRRIDIDYSLVSPDGKYGWNGSWRDDNVLFSGDMTDEGTELFYIRNNNLKPQLLFLNYFNYGEDPVCCKLLVANETPKNFGRNYMVDPANITCVTDFEIDKKQMILGLIADNGVYFSKADVKGGIVGSHNDRSEKLRNHLIHTMRSGLTLNDLIEDAGGVVVSEMSDDVIDLSPQALDKTTILNLLV